MDIIGRLEREDRKRRKVVWLQNVGECPAVPAGELKIGDTLVWNWGATSTLVGIERKGKSVYLTTESKGETYRQRKSIDTLVGVTR